MIYVHLATGFEEVEALTMEFALTLAELLAGKKKADEAAAGLLYSRA